VAVEMPRPCALLMMTMYGHGEMVITANWVVEALMVARLMFSLSDKVKVRVTEVQHFKIGLSCHQSPIIVFRQSVMMHSLTPLGFLPQKTKCPINQLIY